MRDLDRVNAQLAQHRDHVSYLQLRVHRRRKRFLLKQLNDIKPEVDQLNRLTPALPFFLPKPTKRVS